MVGPTLSTENENLQQEFRLGEVKRRWIYSRYLREGEEMMNLEQVFRLREVKR